MGVRVSVMYLRMGIRMYLLQHVITESLLSEVSMYVGHDLYLPNVHADRMPTSSPL